MSAELEEDISVLNIDELDYEDEEGIEDFDLSINHRISTSDAKSKELNLFDIFRHRISSVKGKKSSISTMNRQEDVSKELQSLRDANRALQKECSAMKESRLSAQNECLQLRDKVSSLFRENCSLKEQSAKLTIDNRSLQKQVDSLKQNNARLRDRLQQFSQQLKGFMKNSDGSCSSAAILQHEEEVKQMLDVIGNIPKCEDTKGDPTSWCEKKELQRVPSEKLQNSPVFSLELDHDNLEQISNKLLENLQQENKELEQQYLQMVEIQKQFSNYSATDSLQSCLNSSNVKEKEVLGILESCRSSSKLLKQEVLIQNKLLSTMIKQTNLIKTLQKKMPELQIEMSSGSDATSASSGGSVNMEKNYTATSKGMQDFPLTVVQCPSVKNAGCTPKMVSNLDSLLQTYGIRDWEVGSAGINSCRETSECANLVSEEDRICPMCQAVFPKAFPLPEFEAHVMEHFKNEEFEIITQDVDYG